MVAHLSHSGWSAIGRAVSRSATPRTCPPWLVWLLCVLAWRGPIPVVHSHELEHAQTIEAARHLALYHAATGRQAQRPTTTDGQASSHSACWHLHFVIPDSESAPGTEPDSESSKTLASPGLLPDLMTVACHEWASTPLLHDSVDRWCNQLSLETFLGIAAPLPHAVSIASMQQSTLSRSVAACDRAPHISPHALLCVVRC